MSKCLFVLQIDHFYHMFISNYTKAMQLMLKLLRKDTLFHWLTECQLSIDKLHNALVYSDTLTHGDASKPFILETDVSNFALGSILLQDHDDISCPVVSYYRKPTSSIINYKIHDKGLLTFTSCFYEWHSLLFSNTEPIQARINHWNLIFYTSIQKLNQ